MLFFCEEKHLFLQYLQHERLFVSPSCKFPFSMAKKQMGNFFVAQIFFTHTTLDGNRRIEHFSEMQLLVIRRLLRGGGAVWLVKPKIVELVSSYEPRTSNSAGEKSMGQ